MGIGRCEQEKIARFIWKRIFVDRMHAFTAEYVQGFKIIMAVRRRIAAHGKIPFKQIKICRDGTVSILEGNKNTRIEKLIPPGNDWLYWEIHCHPARANKILNDKIAPFLQEYDTFIPSWFFIRYNEGGPHIRFRIQLKDRQEHPRRVSAFSECMVPGLKSGMVTDLRICTYKREIERYGADMMADVEAHFNNKQQMPSRWHRRAFAQNRQYCQYWQR